MGGLPVGLRGVPSAANRGSRNPGKLNKTHGFAHFYLLNSLTGFLLGGNSDGGR